MSAVDKLHHMTGTSFFEKLCCGCEQVEQSVLQPTKHSDWVDYSGAPHRLLGPFLEAKRAVRCVFFSLLLGNNSINQLTLTLKCPSNFPLGLLLLVHTVIIEVGKVMLLHVPRKWRQALFCAAWMFQLDVFRKLQQPHDAQSASAAHETSTAQRNLLEEEASEKKICFPSDRTLLPTERCCFLIQ